MSAACHFLRQSLHKNAVTAKVEWRIKRRDHAESQRPGHRSQFMNLDISVARSHTGMTDSHDLSFPALSLTADTLAEPRRSRRDRERKAMRLAARHEFPARRRQTA